MTTPLSQAAIDQRRKFFEAKRDHLYQVEIFYCILLEGARSKTGVGTALARLLRDPEGAIAELKSQFTNDSMKKLLRTHIERDLQRLDQHVQAFARQLADFMQIEILNRQGQFTFFRRLLNYDDWRVAGQAAVHAVSRLSGRSTPTSKPNAIICASAITSSGC